MSPSPRKRGPAGEGEAKGLENLSKPYHQSSEEQLVFDRLDPKALSEAAGKKCGQGGG
jgi:hypothetical protein